MRAIVQRVTRASVTVNGEIVGQIGAGLCVLLGVTHGDGPTQITTVARKIAQQRILRTPAGMSGRNDEIGGDVVVVNTPHTAGYVPSSGDDDDPAQRVSAEEAGAPILLISQFTLYADIRKGRRPGWSHAAPGEIAEPIVEAVAHELRDTYGLPVEQGVFGAMMEVALVNDGPFTLFIEAPPSPV